MDYSRPGSSVHGFSRQEYWSRLPFPPPGDLPNPGIKPMSLMFPALAGGFFTLVPSGKPIQALGSSQTWEGVCWERRGLESCSWRISEIVTEDVSLQHEQKLEAPGNSKKPQHLPTKRGREMGACGERSVYPPHLTIGIMVFPLLWHLNLIHVPLTGRLGLESCQERGSGKGGSQP